MCNINYINCIIIVKNAHTIDELKQKENSDILSYCYITIIYYKKTQTLAK